MNCDSSLKKRHRFFLAVFSSLLFLFYSPQRIFAGELNFRFELKLGEIKKVVLTPLSGNPNTGRFVSAVRQHDDILKIVVWDINVDGSLVRRGEVVEGRVKELDVDAIDVARIAVAVQNKDNNLQVVIYDITNAGDLIRRDSEEAGIVSIVSVKGTTDGVVGVAGQIVTTAVRDGDLNLKLTHWSVDQAGQLTRDYDYIAGEVGLIDMGGTNLLVTSVRDASGDLKLTAWGHGGAFLRGGDGTGGPIKKVRVDGAGYYIYDQQFVTASIDPGPTEVKTGVAGTHRLTVGTGVLKLIEWETASSGGGNSIPQGPIIRRAERELGAHEGIAFDLALTEMNWANHWATATAGVSTYETLLQQDQGKPHLRVMVWQPNENGSFTKKAAIALGGWYRSLSLISVATPVQAQDQSRLVVGMRGDNGIMKLVVYDYSG